MFPLAELNFTLSDLKARCERLIGPLNLFDRDTEAEGKKVLNISWCLLLMQVYTDCFEYTFVCMYICYYIYRSN
jgi:hypothetical protein